MTVALAGVSGFGGGAALLLEPRGIEVTSTFSPASFKGFEERIHDARGLIE